ncbi:MAG: hypothetical protein AAGJ38_01525 [Planctomycetota bacterium]
MKVPKEWEGRAIRLGFERLSTDATVYLDGQEVGQINWPMGELAITDAIKPGATHDLLIRVDVDLTGVLYVQDLLLDAYKDSSDVAHAAGLIGSVTLRSEPQGTHIEDVFVRTEVEAQQISLEVDIADLDRAQSVRVVAKMLDHGGEVERTFEAHATADPDAKPNLAVSFDWSDARLWDLDQPELYVLDLSISADSQVGPGGWMDRVQQRFGFREFRIEGRGFVLNGVPIRLRPMETSSTLTETEADQVIKLTRKAGFNQIQPWPQKTSRGMLAAKTHLLRLADEQGLLATAVATDMRDYIGIDGKRWYQNDNAEAYRRLAESELRPLRNHPAIVTWVTTPNFLGHAHDQNPLVIGRQEGGESREAWEDRAPAAREGVATLKAIDDTRPVMLHNGSYVGDIYSVNFYLNWTPLEERRRWFTHYHKHGDMPLLTVETGLPMFTSMMRGRAGYAAATKTEPFVTEYLAEYFGVEAYERETKELRDVLIERFRHQDIYASMHNWPIIMTHEPWKEVQRRHIRDSMLGWRLIGPTAGQLPWNMWVNDPSHEWTDFDREWVAVNADTLAFIAGAPEDVFEQRERFIAGELVTKQLAIVNDARVSKDYTGTWKATLGGKVIAEGEVSGEAPPATHILELIEIALPDEVISTESEHLAGAVTMNIKVGAIAFEDRLDFRVFAPASIPTGADAPEIAVVDPIGKTSEVLRTLGYELSNWVNEQQTPLVVIGRGALSELNLDSLQSLEAYVRAGGLAVLMPQAPEVYQKQFDLRISEQITRQMYPLPGGHTLTEGLDATDLHRFNGVSTLLPHHRDFAYDWRKQDFPNGAHYPAWGWRWGGHHGVTSVPLEIPHRSGATPAMVGGFDLGYSPVLAMPLGQGNLILNTLDLEDHALVDPVAERLLHRMMNPETFASMPAPLESTVYLGGLQGSKLLDAAGVLYDRSETDNPTDFVTDAFSTLLILDGSVGNQQQLDRFLAAGGRALVLPLSEEAYGVKVTHGRYDISAPTVPDWPEAQGLTVANLRPRAVLKRPLIVSGVDDIAADGLLGRRVLGEGVAVFIQADPIAINTDKEPYLRRTAWNQTRILSQVATNLGARFAYDAEFHLSGADSSLLPLPLTSGWSAVLTKPMPPSPSMKERHDDPGISQDAHRLIKQHGAGKLSAADRWTAARVPAPMESYGSDWESADGEAVFVTDVSLPDTWRGQTLSLQLGTIDDNNHVYVNGQLIGKGEGWNEPRTYQISGRLTEADGPLRIAVRVFDSFGGGGMTGGGVIPTLKPRHLPARPGAYHPDYREEFPMGDHPDRYYRW